MTSSPAIPTPASAVLSPARAGGPSPRGLLALVLAAVLVRVALLVWFGNLPIRIWDEKDYDTLARSLATRGEYAFTPGVPTSLRPPLYPALVAGIYRVAGVGNFLAVRAVQAVLSLGLVALVYLLARELFGRRIAAVAAVAMAFYPSFLGFNNLVLTEILFTTWLVAGTYCMLRGVRTGHLGWIAASAAAFGLGALTRSTLWPSFLPFGLWLAWAWRGTFVARLGAVGLYVAVFAAVLAPWTARNTRLEQTFQTVDCMGGRNLMMGNYEYTPLFRSWTTIELEGPRNWFAVLRQAQPDIVQTTQGQRDKVAMKYGVRYALAHPGQTAERAVVKFFDFWGLERELIAGAREGYFGPIPPGAMIPLAVLIIGGYVLALFLGLFGLVLAPPEDRRLHAFMLLAMALICGLHTLTFGHSRYHLPLVPLLLVYAAAAWVHWPQLWARRQQPGFWLAAGLCAIFVAGWTVTFLGSDAQRLRSVLGLST
jgi:4-amino-4-deoxy-L-arabinose transferase-like glycosyltransferase